MQTAICDYMATRPEVLRRTLTWDRGMEMTTTSDRRGYRHGLYFGDLHALAARQQREH